MTSKKQAEFDRSLDRVISEVHNLRGTTACMLAAANERAANLFLQAAVGALQSDLLIRLIRVLERDPKVRSFWFLYHLDRVRVSRGIDVKKLKNLSVQLRKIRNKVFVHIDKDGVFDPRQAYKDAGIRGIDIRAAIDDLWLTLTRLYREQFGREFSGTPTKLDDLSKDFRRDFQKLRR